MKRARGAWGWTLSHYGARDKTPGHAGSAMVRRVQLVHERLCSASPCNAPHALAHPSVTAWDSNAISYAYDDAGRMTTATLPTGTGIVSTYAYDVYGKATVPGAHANEFQFAGEQVDGGTPG